MAKQKIDISQLTPAERLALIEELWDSLQDSDVPVTPSHAQELDRREALRRQNPGRGRPWRDVLDEIQQKRG